MTDTEKLQEYQKILTQQYTNLLLHPHVKIHNDINKKFIKNTIFTTATPIHTIHNITTPNNICGKIIEHIQIYDLIKQHILCDFEVIIKKLENIEDTSTDIKNVKNTKNTKNTKPVSINLCKFVVETMHKYNKKKGVIYFNTQSRARQFYNQMLKHSNNFKTFIYISDNSDITEYENYNFDDTKLKKFEECIDPCIIITCDKLSYGYDNVLIDILYFGDIRSSKIDIRQIMGRGLRNNNLIYPNKLLHIVIPIYKFQLLQETINPSDINIIEKKYSKKDMEQLSLDHDKKSFENLREFLLFIISECGKDIINGKIQNTNKKPKPTPPHPIPPSPIPIIPDGYESIPPDICIEISSTKHGKYTEFIKFLKANNIYNDLTYNNFKNMHISHAWMPILGEIRQRYKKFCFKDINAIENANYYKTLNECNTACDNITNITIKEFGGEEQVTNMLKSIFNETNNKNILKYDTKIPLNKILYYYE